MNANDITNAANAITYAVEFDTNKENRNIKMKGDTHTPILTPIMLLWFNM